MMLEYFPFTSAFGNVKMMTVRTGHFIAVFLLDTSPITERESSLCLLPTRSFTSGSGLIHMIEDQHDDQNEVSEKASRDIPYGAAISHKFANKKTS